MRYLHGSHHDGDAAHLRQVSLTERADAVDWRAQPVLPDALKQPSRATPLGRWTRQVVVASAVWSVIELPFEIWASMTTRNALACVAAKLLWVTLVGFVLAGSRVARIAYAFLCTIGLTAVAFGLPVEYRVFPLGFILSSVECVLKASAFVCLVSAGIYPDEE